MATGFRTRLCSAILMLTASMPALAASPLLSSTTPALRLRGLTDLGAHPAPYPPAAQARLQQLAGDHDPQVAAKAQELLGKKG